MARKAGADDSSFKRLGGGRWQTRDERFTIEPQSGTWVVVDAEQTDDLGLPLVRGPFRSLGDAKEAIVGARSGPAEPSPLAERIERRKAAPEKPPAGRRGAAEPATKPERPPGKASQKPRAAQPEEPAEPRWISALEPDRRRDARRLLARLDAAGAPDAEGLARRDVVGDVPAVAAWAIERQLADLGSKAHPDEVVARLADGRDDDLGVRWRLVDGEGRPITVARTPARRGREPRG